MPESGKREKSDYLQQKKLNPADDLRELLDSLETRRVNLKRLNSTQALILLRDLDLVYTRLDELEPAGLDLTGERSRFESIQMRVKAEAGTVLKALGGPAALETHRPKPAPEENRWWWYLDALVAARQKRLLKRGLIALAIVGLIIGGLVVAFNTVLAPSPEVVARLEAHNQAYLQTERDDYQGALAALEAGLTQVPDDPELLIFKGVVQQRVGQAAEAEQSFNLAQAQFTDPALFYLGRGQLLLRLEDYEQAGVDAQSALDLDQNRAAAWLLLGQALEAQGRTFEAIPAYEKAGQLALDSGENEIVVLARLALGRIGGGSGLQ